MFKAEYKPSEETGQLFEALYDDSGYSNSDGETSSPAASPTRVSAQT